MWQMESLAGQDATGNTDTACHRKVRLSQARVQGQTDEGSTAGNKSCDPAAAKSSDSSHRSCDSNAADCQRQLYAENQISLHPCNDSARGYNRQGEDSFLAGS